MAFILLLILQLLEPTLVSHILVFRADIKCQHLYVWKSTVSSLQKRPATSCWNAILRSEKQVLFTSLHHGPMNGLWVAPTSDKPGIQTEAHVFPHIHEGSVSSLRNPRLKYAYFGCSWNLGIPHEIMQQSLCYVHFRIFSAHVMKDDLNMFQVCEFTVALVT